MTAILENRKFVLVYPNDYYLLPRSEGRIKSYESCNDIRAWSLHDCDRSDHLIDLIKINDDCCRGLVPRQALLDILSSMGGGDRHKVDEGLIMKIDPPPAVKEPIGDSEENERELKRIITAKDKNIEALQREIEELKAKCKTDPIGGSEENEKELKRIIAAKEKEIEALQKEIEELKAKCKADSKGGSEENESELKRIIAAKEKEIEALQREIEELKNKLKNQSDNLSNSLQEKNKQLQDNVDKLQDEIKRLQDQIKKLKEDNAKCGEGSADNNGKIAELEKMIRELTSERDGLQRTNADLAKDLEELRIQLESLNSLTKELNNYANKAHSMHGNGEKYHDLLEMFKVALDEDIAKAKTVAGALKKERKQLEEQIKSQLDEALEMYIAALEEIQKKQMEIDRLSKELNEMKSKNDELAKNCGNVKGDNRPERPPDVPKPVKGISQDIGSQTEMETYQPPPKPEINIQKQPNKQTVSAPNSARSPTPHSGYQNMCEMNKCTAKCRSTSQRVASCCPYCERRNQCVSSSDFRSFSVSNAMCDAIRKLQNDLNAKQKRSNKTVISQCEDRHVKSKRITHDNWDLTLPMPHTNPEIEIDNSIQQMMDMQVQFPDCSLMIRTGT